jgi:hypothetical protein
MATIGKICLALTVIGMIVISAYLLPAVGKSQNDVAKNLRESEEAMRATADQHRKAKMDLIRSSSRLAQLQIGWDKSWDIPQSGNSGVAVQGTRLAVTGLGTDNGLIQGTDQDGQPFSPAVHVFKIMPEGSVYVGEFVAEQIDANNTTLEPTWQVTNDETKVWVENPDVSWRFRTQVPSAKRLRIDRLNLQLQDLDEKDRETAANVVRQKKSLDDAVSQLEIRKQELTGKPGLTANISAIEDQRNNLVVQIDELRRQIKGESEEREAILRRLKELSERLPSADDAQITQSRDTVR